MQTLLQNLAYSLRMMRKSPGLTLTVLLTLALGIGANTAIFTVDYATLLAPLPYPEPRYVQELKSIVIQGRGMSVWSGHAYFTLETCSWRIRTHAAIGVWYRPRQCFCHRYDLKSRLVHSNASTGVRPSSPA